MEKLVTLYARLRLSRSSTKRRPPCPESTAESTSRGQRAASDRRAPGNPSTRCACALSSFLTANRGASGGSSWIGAIGARGTSDEGNLRTTLVDLRRPFARHLLGIDRGGGICFGEVVESFADMRRQALRPLREFVAAFVAADGAAHRFHLADQALRAPGLRSFRHQPRE